MGRTVKVYDERYNEFLDVAQRLFYSQGYAQTSVQEIIDAIGVAKGLFYYYFRSKADLLDAIVARMTQQVLASLTPLVQDPALAAPQKLTLFFDRTQSWKLANKAILLELLRVIYRDENLPLATKVAAATMPTVVPLLAQIIRQGVDEGVFDVTYPEVVAEMLLKMGQALSEMVAHQLLAWEAGAASTAALDDMERRVQEYERGMARVLGAAEGSLRVIDPALLRQWFA